MNPNFAGNYCRKLVKKEAKNFYYGFLLLKPEKRQAIYALYAFCRILDDAADDNSLSNNNPTLLKKRFSNIIDAKGTLSKRDQIISSALRKAVADFQIPRKELDWIIDGVLMDFKISRYQGMNDLRKYLFGVASAVGLACIEIFKYRSPEARRYAIYLGYAMQLTNIIRDVREDYLRNRIYLPMEDLNRFNVKEEDLGREKTSDSVCRLLSFEAQRAETFFKKAQHLWPLLSRDAAPCPYALSLIYGNLLKIMKKNNFLVLEKRFSLPSWQKLFLMLRAKSAFLL